MKQCYGCFNEYDEALDMCPHCGYEEGDGPEAALHLAPGRRLKNKYIIGQVLGYGGFGVTYLAWDTVLEQRVAIKEYLPSEFSTRVPGQTEISVFGGDKSEQFYDGIEKFVEEANRLAQFRNTDGIVRIFESLTENNTAYIVMEYLKGQTLTQYLEKSGQIPADEAIRLMTPVLQSLQIVHEQGVIHRDIAPDNIIVTDDGEVKLIDFGAARYATTSHSRSLTVVIKPGYSPEEQYRSRGDQGAWTDVYAVGATLYRMITGQAPPDAMERRAFFENKKRDILTPLSKLSKRVSANRETAILNAMNVRIEDRTPNMSAFEQELNAESEVKRRQGKIKKIDVLKWPLWTKIAIPVAACLVVVLSVLFATGKIGFRANLKVDLEVPEGMARVPSVISNDVSSATTRAEDSQLLIKIVGKEESDEIPANLVLFQDLSAGSFVNVNTELCIKISAGKAVDVTIKDNDGNLATADVQYRVKEDAVKLLESQGMKVKLEEQSSETVAAGVVISQNPTAGTAIPPGTQVTLVVSTGGAVFDMPSVVGKAEAAAVKELSDKGILFQLEYANDTNVPVGNVISQSLSAGAPVTQGAKVILTVSSGKTLVQVPNVIGQEKNAAGNDLQKLGLQVSLGEGVSGKPKDEIISQAPHAGTSLEEGGIVAITVSRGQCTLALDAQGGTAAASAVSANIGGTVGSLPQPSRANYSFVGWFTQASGGSQVTAATTIEGDMKVYARWTQDIFKVSYNANGGSAAQSSQQVPGGQGINLPLASRNHYSFTGWYTAATGGTRVENGTAVTASMTLYAQWAKTVYTVTYNANGGSVTPATVPIDSGEKIGSLPTPTQDYHKFLGWYNGSAKVSESFVVAGSITLSARWEKIVYTVTFQPNGGNVSPASVQLDAGKAIGSLPTPTRNQYDFTGWYQGLTKVDTSFVAQGNVTLSAQWKQKGVTDWVLASQVPADAQIVNRKWGYTLTQTKSSYNATESGWSLVRSEWQQSATGKTQEWGNLAVAYDSKGSSLNFEFATWHALYNSTLRARPVGNETATTKRVMGADSQVANIYAHWTNTSNNYYGVAINRYINEHSGPANYGTYTEFRAIRRSMSEAQFAAGAVGNNNAWVDCYKGLEGASWDVAGGSYWWYRIPTYTTAYTDYRKLFYWQKVEKKESTTQVTAGSGISSITEYVQYRPK